MAGILRRTMFMDLRNNQVRFMDWNQVDTGLGTMYEPRQHNTVRMGRKEGYDSFDPLDQLARVDELLAADGAAEWNYLTGKGMVLHGGPQVPKSCAY